MGTKNNYDNLHVNKHKATSIRIRQREQRKEFKK